MNLVLLFPDDFIDNDRVVLQDRRRDHILQIHRAQTGQALTVGLVNGMIGTGRVTHADINRVELSVSLTQPPPKALPLTLVLALPRPKMLKRVLQTVATMGVKKLILINSYRVEKSYWQTPILDSENIKSQLILGLEQARDTRLPEVILRKRFKPFVEDELPTIVEGSRALVAHPGNFAPCPRDVKEQLTLAVGPEGGFIPYEVEKLNDCGFETVSLGERILRVETAIPVLLAKLF